MKVSQVNGFFLSLKFVHKVKLILLDSQLVEAPR